MHCVADAETAETGLTGARWMSVGSVLGRLHRRLADHPAAAPSRRPATGVCDVDQAQTRYDRLIAAYRRTGTADAFQEWALDAALQRRALLRRVRTILQELPQLTTQVLHGDLAAPNVLLRGSEVAAVIDFKPPATGYVSWEIARIGCDPRTVVRDDQWMSGMRELLRAYDDENPSVARADLISAVAVGCAYTLASTYLLAEPLENPGGVDETLQAYGRACHAAVLRLLERLGDVSELLREIPGRR